MGSYIPEYFIDIQGFYCIEVTSTTTDVMVNCSK